MIPRVLGKNLLCLEIKKPVEPGKLILTPGITQSQMQYKVISIGNDVKDVDEGSTIITSYFSGIGMEYEGNNYTIISVDNILAII